MRISLKKFLSVHLSAAAAVILYLALGVQCPIKYFFHFNCPACGMTRAMFSLFRGNVSAYFHYNPMALPAVLLLLFAFHKKFFKISEKAKNIIIIIGAILIFAVYIIRLIF